MQHAAHGPGSDRPESPDGGQGRQKSRQASHSRAPRRRSVSRKPASVSDKPSAEAGSKPEAADSSEAAPAAAPEAGEAAAESPKAAPEKGSVPEGKPASKEKTAPKGGDETKHESRKEEPEGPGDESAETEAPVPADDPQPTVTVDTSVSVQQVKQRQVFKENPNVYYMNGESLSRPMTLPPSAKVGITVIIAIAAIIAAVAFYMYFDATTNEPAREQARMEENLNRGVTLDLPSLLEFLPLDDASIDAQLKATGAAFFERSPVGSGEDYEMIKLPADLPLADAAAMYATGVSKLSPSQAARLLNGAWDLVVDRSNGIDVSLHYADFSSGSEAAAIENAIAAEDLSRGEVTDSGDNDGYGNHFTAGTIMIGGTIYDWTASAVALKEVYSISGLPDDAMYVGVRIKGAPEE